jgi:hypothetical protein
MKPISQKTLDIIKYFKGHPAAEVAAVSKKFKANKAYVYKIRARAFAEMWKPPELLDTPQTLDKAFGVSLKDVPDHPSEEMTRKAIAVAKELSKTDTILDTRATQYGTFADGASLMQAIKRTMADHAQKHGKTFADDQWEALEMIVHKMARIVNGNPDNVDSWRDIAGYAVLIADRLEGNAR